MKRQHTVMAVVIAIFLASAIASAGIYGVVSVVQSDSAILQEEETDAADGTEIDATVPVDELLYAIDDDEADEPEVPPPFQLEPQPDGANDSPEDGPEVRVSRLSEGQLVPASRANVNVVLDGQVVARESIDRGGVAQLDPLPAEIHTLVIQGTDGYAVARTVLSADAIAEVALCPWVDARTIDQILRNDVYGGATVATIGDAVSTAGWLGLDDGFVIGSDGAVSGRVTITSGLGEEPRGIVNSRALFIRAGEIIAEDLTDARGEFQVSGLSPGAASFVVASDKGFLAVAVLIHPADEIVSTQRTELSFVSFDDAPKTNADAAPPGDVQAGSGAGAPGGGPGGGGGPPGGPFGPPLGGGGGGFGGGSGGGFSGGGGGVGGGGGLLGALLGGLGGAALGWALADNNNDSGGGTVSP